MTKIKFSKSELKRQRDSLKQFLHYLPTLQLKKQQLQIKILEARELHDAKMQALQEKENEMNSWIGLLADPAISEPLWWDFPFIRHPSPETLGKTDLKKWIHPRSVVTGTLNIAGANIPFLKEVQFLEPDYDFYSTPLWIDQAMVELREVMKLLVEMEVIKKQIAILQHELRITTQRVNLFEKIKIPECQENIRMIRIYLGDQMANSVGISKVAKRKLETIAAV